MRYLLPILLCLTGCLEEEPGHIEKEVHTPIEQPTTKWKVESQGFFKAGFENNKREILIITSPKGKKFLAITGCGVTELVKVGSGEDSHTAEE